MLCTLWQTLIGAAAAIVGGLGAALWQTYRADDIAKRIRHDERQERALVDLYGVIASVDGRVHRLYEQVQRGRSAVQYQTAVQTLDEIRQYWETTASSVITDLPIVRPYTLQVAIHNELQ